MILSGQRSRRACISIVIAALAAWTLHSTLTAQASQTLYTSSAPGFNASAATVPAGICFVTITAAGGSGGAAQGGNLQGSGGLGAVVVSRVPVTPGNSFSTIVGGGGGSSSEGGDGGFGGGGGGGYGGPTSNLTSGGGGGGASVVAVTGGPLLAVAGGGGGGGATNGFNFAGDGGNGGEPGGAGATGGTPGSGGPGGSGGDSDGTGGDGTHYFNNPSGGGGGIGDGGTRGASLGGDGGNGNGTFGGGGGGGATFGQAATDGGAGGTGSGNAGMSSLAGDGGAGTPGGGDGGTAGSNSTPAGGGGGAGGLGFGGGSGGSQGGGGGGGGYGGGAGGAVSAGGGGGSSFVTPDGALTSSSATNSGDGYVTITYDPDADACPIRSLDVSSSGGTIAVEIDDNAGCEIASAVTTTADAVAGGAPDGVTFPYDLVDLQLTSCSPGGSVDVTVTYPDALPSGAAFWKWGPTPDNTTPHWYTMSTASIAGDTVTYTITDGGEGDDDLTPNGTIEDPGGAAVAAAVPVMPAWMFVVLMVALVAAGRFALVR